MFIVQLRFSKNKAQMSRLMEAHRQWVDQGFREGVFLIVGTLAPRAGGGIVAHNTSLAQLKQRIKRDPFVAEDVVAPEIVKITPARTIKVLQGVLK